VQVCNSSTRETETGGSQVQGQPELHSEFKDSLDYTVKSCPKNLGKKERERKE
jgi:hypothetical protein